MTRVPLIDSLKDVQDAQLVVLPGVGTFGATLDLLNAAQVTDVIKARIAAGMHNVSVFE